MKKKGFNCYLVDLYSGSGANKLNKEQLKTIGSPIVSLTKGIFTTKEGNRRFDKWFFVEKNEDFFIALRKRLCVAIDSINNQFQEKIAIDADVILLHGDCKEKVDEIISNIEKDSTGSNVAILAFVDPYALSHFEWSSLEKLSKFHHIDVIFTLPTSSYVRNKANYRDFEKYVPRLNEHEKKDIESGKIDQKSLSEIYARGLANLIKTTIRYYKEGVIIKNSKNSEIYRITLFTRSEVGARIMYNLVSRLNRMDNREIEVEIQKITGIQSPLSKFFK